MGRKSRQKRERRERGNGPLPKVVDGYSRRSLFALLEAASASPTAAHRGPSLALLFQATAQRHDGDGGAAAPDLLSELVGQILSLDPRVQTWEDFQPYDARAEVVVRWGPSLFRLLPGSLERPTAMVNNHILLASVIDRTLMPTLGFGLFDAGEMLLRRIDHVAGRLAPGWREGPAAQIGDAPRVTQAETDAAAELTPLGELANECTRPSCAAAAAAQYTIEAKNLRADPSHPVSTFGTTVAGVR